MGLATFDVPCVFVFVDFLLEFLLCAELFQHFGRLPIEPINRLFLPRWPFRYYILDLGQDSWIIRRVFNWLSFPKIPRPNPCIIVNRCSPRLCSGQRRHPRELLLTTRHRQSVGLDQRVHLIFNRLGEAAGGMGQFLVFVGGWSWRVMRVMLDLRICTWIRVRFC